MGIDYLLVDGLLVNSKHGVGYSRDSKGNLVLIQESSAWDPIYVDLNIGLVPKFEVQEFRLNSNVYVVPQEQNYYHWMLDVLPFIIGIRQVDPEVILVGNKLQTNFQIQTLFGDTRHLAEGFDWQVIRNLYLPSQRHQVGLPEAKVIDLIISHFRNIYPVSSVDKLRMIYVSRRNSTRSLVNEDEVESILSNLGFEVVLSENMSFAEQLDLFRSAKLILGPHGAGLTNLIFAEQKCQIIELIPEEFHNTCYEHLSKLREFDYRALNYSEFSTKQNILCILNRYL